MNNLVKILFFIPLLFIACSSSDDDNNKIPVSTDLVGVWTLQSKEATEMNVSPESAKERIEQYLTSMQEEETVEFKANGTFAVSGQEVGRFTTDNGKLVMFDSNLNLTGTYSISNGLLTINQDYTAIVRADRDAIFGSNKPSSLKINKTICSSIFKRK